MNDENKPRKVSYVLDDTEVVMTGRTASRHIGDRRWGPKEEMKYEVTPADQSLGTWRRWVDEQDLLKVDEG